MCSIAQKPNSRSACRNREHNSQESSHVRSAQNLSASRTTKAQLEVKGISQDEAATRFKIRVVDDCFVVRWNRWRVNIGVRVGYVSFGSGRECLRGVGNQQDGCAPNSKLASTITTARTTTATRTRTRTTTIAVAVAVAGVVSPTIGSTVSFVLYWSVLVCVGPP